MKLVGLAWKFGDCVTDGTQKEVMSKGRENADKVQPFRPRFSSDRYFHLGFVKNLQVTRNWSTWLCFIRESQLPRNMKLNEINWKVTLEYKHTLLDAISQFSR